mmetsp:Transcript_3750/g.10837  ORF Transcript_3750/g.10837 Transcript_3750/m.10837 type:complete len:285 (-) Transcript_3750:460-1314(-)
MATMGNSSSIVAVGLINECQKLALLPGGDLPRIGLGYRAWTGTLAFRDTTLESPLTEQLPSCSTHRAVVSDSEAAVRGEEASKISSNAVGQHSASVRSASRTPKSSAWKGAPAACRAASSSTSAYTAAGSSCTTAILHALATAAAGPKVGSALTSSEPFCACASGAVSPGGARGVERPPSVCSRATSRCSTRWKPLAPRLRRRRSRRHVSRFLSDGTCGVALCCWGCSGASCKLANACFTAPVGQEMAMQALMQHSSAGIAVSSVMCAWIRGMPPCYLGMSLYL